MKFFRTALILVIALAALSSAAFAQEEPVTNATPPPPNPYSAYQGRQSKVLPPDRVYDTLSRPYYEAMAKQALASRPANFDFDAFRMNYAGTAHYDPVGETSRNHIVELAYDIRNETDPVKREKLLDNYAEFLVAQLGNIDVVSQAIILSEDDRRLGDPDFFRWMRQGLLKSVLRSGDGSNLDHSYYVITLGEDTALIGALNVQSINIESRESAGFYYSMHLVKDAGHTRPYTIFVNTTKPMAYMAEMKLRAGAFVSIRKQ